MCVRVCVCVCLCAWWLVGFQFGCAQLSRLPDSTRHPDSPLDSQNPDSHSREWLVGFQFGWHQLSRLSDSTRLPDSPLDSQTPDSHVQCLHVLIGIALASRSLCRGRLGVVIDFGSIAADLMCRDRPCAVIVLLWSLVSIALGWASCTTLLKHVEQNPLLTQ